MTKFYSLITICLLVLFSTQVSQAQIGNIIGRNTVKKPQYINSSSSSNLSSSSRHLEERIDVLVSGIVDERDSDAVKALAIFRWITANISYDMQLKGDRKLQREIYTSEENVILHVLKRKKALCGGYALLFKSMCSSAHISAEVVHGTSKKYHKRRSGNQVDHSWNRVQLNGKWELLDITWAISFGTKNKPNLFWYRTRPTDFYLTHFPQSTFQNNNTSRSVR